MVHAGGLHARAVQDLDLDAGVDDIARVVDTEEDAGVRALRHHEVRAEDEVAIAGLGDDVAATAGYRSHAAVLDDPVLVDIRPTLIVHAVEEKLPALGLLLLG